MPRTPIGIVGLGLIGSAMADRLSAAGVPVCGFDIVPDRMEGVAASGTSPTPWTSLVECKVIVIAVYDGPQAERVVADIIASGFKPTIICVTTCDLDTVKRLASRAAAAKIQFVEAPISGTSAEVRDGGSSVFIGADAASQGVAQSVMSLVCANVFVVGGLGSASLMKLAINLVLQSNRAALAEGIAFAEAVGINGASFLKAAKVSAAYSRVMETKGEKMLQRDFSPQSRIGQTLKDADLILSAAEANGLKLRMTSAQRTILSDTIAAQGTDVDSCAIIATLLAHSKATA
ncbi:2-hydroxy-3-oxopropionate reductase [Variibacter gotjawalensis]|uniref:2-hydroxy-3-oxopropionate reductase n=1 Tax=Variibacter gotjawalensis TaxID=1333996 RepID=A0A0S3PRL1_9BRAD|nr:NAD(P)-dependent oxidoreductase [Variibacter gotjawalensis]NIK48903.1 3-hydroxyisobutyrate dehydrogenase-like beta-hydroxyacid dehydrogenase [Variibacter gotjawalensis]RZS50759.1 2-hydroxy-3-oxopropionate reductase [Variibacter gotjawalensis]BAT58593.1 2-hydroxy-3-oxopropionate reductase [Variibacter gotjawalensis]